MPPSFPTRRSSDLNAGTFRKSAGTNTTSLQGNVVFNNTGTVDAQSGTLVFNNGGSFSSSSVISGGGSILLQSGAFTLNGQIGRASCRELAEGPVVRDGV